MMEETLHMKVGPLLGEHLLEIAQTNISKGNVEYALDVYIKGLCGFTKEYALMCLKNKAVLITDEDGEGVSLTDSLEEIEKNSHNILDWELIITNRITDLYNTIKAIHKTANDFMKLYNGNIEDYSILDMMGRYFNDEQLKTIGKHNIAARIIGSPNGKICDKGSSNPTSVWESIEYAMETEDNDLSKWEKILYYTVQYNKLIKMLHKDYMNFENTYLFLVENEFIKKPSRVEHMIELAMEVLWKFSNTSTGYYHPLCNTGLYDYKEKLSSDLIKTHFGNEYAKNGIIKKDIMDGYDAGWLSPEGEFYGGDGPTSNMIHMNIAEKIFDAPTNKYAVKMAKDGVSIFGVDSPEYWLEQHGWMKIHHDEVYGYFRWDKNDNESTKLYVPTDIQLKMIYAYIDKYYNSKLYPESKVLSNVNPISTYKLRQMDDIKLHEVFCR